MQLDWIKNIALKLIPRLAAAVALFYVFNGIYTATIYPTERQRFSKVAGKLDTAFQEADVVYLGESSNTSFNPWTDTLAYSVAEWIQYYFKGIKVQGVSHDGYHVGMFKQMLGLISEDRLKRKPLTVVVTVNMRTFGPAAVFSANEASNQQEAVFYSRRLPLLNRVFVSLHHYDNRNAMEMEREKSMWWRTQDLREAMGLDARKVKFKGMESLPNTRSWIEAMAGRNYELPSEVRNMADAYIKEFAWVLDDQNPRLLALKAMVDECKERNINLVCLLLIPNRAHAEALFGEQLTQYIDYNLAFLRDRIMGWQRAWDAKTGDCGTGVSALQLVDMPRNYTDNFGSFPSGKHYTDQYFPTEHVDAHLRGYIAAMVAQNLGSIYPKNYLFTDGRKLDISALPGKLVDDWDGKNPEEELGVTMLFPPKNNMPNFNIKMPYSDSLLRVWQEKRH